MTDAPDSPLDWTADGQPRSRLFGDIYFSPEDGLAETKAVFLQGCGLPEAWLGRRRFVVGELGFGTGLNIAALLDLWGKARPEGAHLHVFTVEAHPVTAEEARRALAHWPELAEVAALLTARWPGRARGLHRIDLPELAATIDVAVTDVREALEGWTGRADAWFLDGFSPALNPQMWSEEILALVGQRAAPGARAATFTVAGHVRRALAAAGFAVEKRPGYGRKRERLEAMFPGVAADPPSPRIAIVGAGIAGATVARAVRALGAEALVVDAGGTGAGASGNPAALVTPRLDAGLGPPARLFAQAFRRAVQLYDTLPDAIIARGVSQLPRHARDPARFGALAASDIFEPGSLAVSEAGVLTQREALVVEPAVALGAWLGEVRTATVATLDRSGEAWRLLDPEGGLIAEADAVIVCAAMGSAALAGLPLRPVRGQASWTALADRPAATAWGGYAIPTRGGVLFGATHDRDDDASDVRQEDHARNLATLAEALPDLAARLAGAPLSGRAAVRATTPDRLPIAGALGPPGLFALTGLGSRGFSFAPLLAEHVAALALDAPSPLPAPLAGLVAPARLSADRRRPI